MSESKYLIPEWRQCWRWFSMHAMALAAALLAAWFELPEDVRAAMPSWMFPGVVIVVLLLGMFGRVMKQAAPPAPPPAGEQE